MQRTTMDDAVTQVVRHQRNEDDVEEVQQNDIIEDGTTVGQAEAAMVDHPPSAHKVQETHYGTSSVAESGYYPSCSSDYSISSQSSYATTRPDSSDYCGSNGSIPMSTCSVSVSSHRDERQEQEVKTPVEIAFVAQPKKNQVTIDCSTKIMHLSSDTMVNILTFLEPEEVVDVMTMPICKEWIKSYTTNCYIWRELCRLEPFKAKFCDMDDSDSTFIDDDSDYYSFCSLREVDACEEIRYMKFRSMYASFVTCMKYLRGIKEGKRNDQVSSETKLKDGQIRSYNTGIPTEEIQRTPNGVARSEYYLKKGTKKRAKQSILSDSTKKPRTSNGSNSSPILTSSCSIYSIVNWMIAYSHVEGIQTMCMEIFPILLEDEHERITAQRIGMVDIVLQSMDRFQDNVRLHVSSFHTLVILFRPIGGREGMMVDYTQATSFATSLGLPLKPSTTSTSGGQYKIRIAVMIESMSRFESESHLQAMACWAMVNLALVPTQKNVIVTNGGLQAACRAMARHPDNFEVQFRAMFALINLVVPSKTADSTEQEVIYDNASSITILIVSAMKQFSSSYAIRNRACLVLHNLSQNEQCVRSLLLTPECYQMLTWCFWKSKTDKILRRSIGFILKKLQGLITADPTLRRHTEALMWSPHKPVSDVME